MAVNKGNPPTKRMPRDGREKDLFQSMHQGSLSRKVGAQDLFERMHQGKLGSYKVESPGPSVGNAMNLGHRGKKGGKKRGG